MEIGNGLRRSDREKVIIKSLIWNAIIEVFKEEKDMDITKYLGSIQFKGNTVFVKTTKPIIKWELLLLDDKIRDMIKTKLKIVGIIFLKMEIKYM